MHNSLICRTSHVHEYHRPTPHHFSLNAFTYFWSKPRKLLQIPVVHFMFNWAPKPCWPHPPISRSKLGSIVPLTLIEALVEFVVVVAGCFAFVVEFLFGVDYGKCTTTELVALHFWCLHHTPLTLQPNLKMFSHTVGWLSPLDSISFCSQLSACGRRFAASVSICRGNQL